MCCSRPPISNSSRIARSVSTERRSTRSGSTLLRMLRRATLTKPDTLGSMAPTIAFLQPTSVEEAVEGLRAYGEDAKVVAGATALSILLRQRLLRPSALISLGGLPHLRDIVRED